MEPIRSTFSLSRVCLEQHVSRHPVTVYTLGLMDTVSGHATHRLKLTHRHLAQQAKLLLDFARHNELYRLRCELTFELTSKRVTDDERLECEVHLEEHRREHITSGLDKWDTPVHTLIFSRHYPVPEEYEIEVRVIPTPAQINHLQNHQYPYCHCDVRFYELT